LSQEFFLEDNRLRSLPPKFGKLKKLEFLELGNNQLSELPASVTKVCTVGRHS
jgi:Leucine-rich repeat (LRR) protein